MRSSHDIGFSGFSKTVLGAAVALVCASPVMAQTAAGADDGQPRAKEDNRAVIDRVMEDRTRQHQSVHEGHFNADRVACFDVF